MEKKNISYSDWSPQQIRAYIIIKIPRVVGLFKLSDDPVKKEQKIEDLADTFMEVYNQTLQHQ